MPTPKLTERCHSVCDVLAADLVEGAPSEVAIVGRMGSITETDRDGIRDGALRWAAFLSDRIEPGDRVVICMPTSADFLHVFFGTLYAGGVAVPLPSMVPVDEDYIPGFLEARVPRRR